MQKVRVAILVVDDEPDVVGMIARDLGERGYDVATATAGRAAIAMARTRRFDVVVTDLRMPDLDGMATTVGLKAVDPDIDVVIATGYASEETREECLERGASDFLRKPFSLSELETVLERVLARRESRQGSG